MQRLAAAFVLVIALVERPLLTQDLGLPNRPDTVKFAAIGDNGTGEPPQYEVADQLTIWHGKFPFDLVIMLGDNLYGSQGPADFVRKFERPYRPLLDAGVQFFACLGNHDRTNNDSYRPFNMNGNRYYTHARKNVRFFVLDSNELDPAQLVWIEGALKEAAEPWKIAYLHHPLYSNGGRHGSEVELRVRLEPIFVKYGVQVVYSGHDHVYERLKPQRGIQYFVSGAAGQLRKGDLRPSADTAAGFDQDRSFMLNEVAGDDLFFQVISRTGQTVDRGVVHRESKP